MARQVPEGLLGIHSTSLLVIRAAEDRGGGCWSAGLRQQDSRSTEKERETFDALAAAGKMGNRSYATMKAGMWPQTVGYAITGSSPACLAAWMLGHPGFSRWT